MKEEYSVTFFRLDNGEDIIADSIHVLKDDMEEEHYILDNPLKVVYLASNEDRRSSMSISLMQWVFPKISPNNQFKIKASKILTTAEASDNLVDFYFETIENMEKWKDKKDKNENIEEEDFEEYSEEDAMNFMEELMEHLKNTKKTLH